MYFRNFAFTLLKFLYFFFYFGVTNKLKLFIARVWPMFRIGYLKTDFVMWIDVEIIVDFRIGSS